MDIMNNITLRELTFEDKEAFLKAMLYSQSLHHEGFEQHKLRITQKTTFYQQNWSVIKNAIQEKIKVLMLQDA